MDSQFWLGLENLDGLFFGLPADIVAFIVLLLGVLCALGIKRIFF